MKIVHNKFPLTRSANRIGLLCGIVAGTVDSAEIEAAVINDSMPRPRKKPVRAEGIYFESITDAAKALVSMENGRMNKDDFYRAVQSRAKKIARMCDQDCWDGYFWEN